MYCMDSTAPEAGRSDLFKGLSDEGMRTLEELAALIIPSDSTGPGASDAEVARNIIERLAGNSEWRECYGAGLLRFDVFALRQYGKPFSCLKNSQKVSMVQLIEQAECRMHADPKSMAGKVIRKFCHWYYARWLHLEPLIGFWKRLQRDVFLSFYSSPVAWAWLGYPGAPDPAPGESVSNRDVLQ